MDALHNHLPSQSDSRSSKPWLPLFSIVPSPRLRIWQWFCGGLNHMLVAMRCKRKQVLFVFLLLIGVLWTLSVSTSSYSLPERTVLLNPLNDSLVAVGYGKDTCGDPMLAEVDVGDSENVLKGPPTEWFRDNLRNDSSYITSWSNAGFTNQFMSYVNMIYLGIISERIPIVPPFAPDHHILASAGILPFGDIFDLADLRRQLQIPVLEWRDVKKLQSRYSLDPYVTSTIEPLGCWTTRKENEGEPIRAENVVHHLGVDASYTRVPTRTRLHPTNTDDPHVVFPELAALVHPRNPIVRPDSLKTLAPSPGGHWRLPDEHLSCVDTMYYVTSGVESFEWRFSWSPAWMTVGRRLRFTQALKHLGREYLAKVFGLSGQREELPLFIAVHVRRGDFKVYCSTKSEECLPQLSAYKKHVDNIKTQLLTKRGLAVSDVLVTSDEKSPAFWDDVRSQGWLHVNHTQEQTLERFGEWYPPLIDSVIQSMAVGFVGTEDSTFSLVSQRRVEDWAGGVALNVNVQNGR